MLNRRFENQAYRASCLNLFVAAIILWNTPASPTGGRGVLDSLTHFPRHRPLWGGNISRSPATIAGSLKAVPIPASFARSAYRLRSWLRDNIAPYAKGSLLAYVKRTFL
nr:hypothetical protein [Novosphingobium sp. THN1]